MMISQIYRAFDLGLYVDSPEDIIWKWIGFADQRSDRRIDFVADIPRIAVDRSQFALLCAEPEESHLEMD